MAEKTILWARMFRVIYTQQRPSRLPDASRAMSEDVKRMADLLKSGATMLSDVCPNCGSPLFKVKSDIFCAKCNKPVVYARATGPQATVSPSMLLESVEQTVIGKISETNELLKAEKDPERLSAYSNLVFGWLSMLEKLRNLKQTLNQS